MAASRVLFVDDDVEVLNGLERALRKHRHRWDMVFATGGPAGLDAVRSATFDVVISDMRMPELDGAALLRHVRDHDPTTIRMILSGFSDPSAAMRARPITHEFFDKPCSLKALAVEIDRGIRLRALFASEPLRAAIARIANHPALAPGFLTGPEHDLGKMLIEVALPEVHAAILQHPETCRSQVERELIGATHGELGAYLLVLRGTSLAIIEAVALQDREVAPTIAGIAM